MARPYSLEFISSEELELLRKGCIQSHQYTHDNTLIKRCGICARSETREGLGVTHLPDCPLYANEN